MDYYNLLILQIYHGNQHGFPSSRNYKFIIVVVQIFKINLISFKKIDSKETTIVFMINIYKSYILPKDIHLKRM